MRDDVAGLQEVSTHKALNLPFSWLNFSGLTSVTSILSPSPHRSNSYRVSVVFFYKHTISPFFRPNDSSNARLFSLPNHLISLSLPFSPTSPQQLKLAQGNGTSAAGQEEIAALTVQLREVRQMHAADVKRKNAIIKDLHKDIYNFQMRLKAGKGSPAQTSSRDLGVSCTPRTADKLYSAVSQAGSIAIDFSYLSASSVCCSVSFLLSICVCLSFSM